MSVALSRNVLVQDQGDCAVSPGPASTFVVLVLIGVLVTWRIRKENAPEEYTPGETSKDITSALSAPAAQRRKARVKRSKTR